MSVSHTPGIGAPRRLSYRRYIMLLSPFALALALVLIGGYLMHWRWTGYLSTERPHPPRTLWDWLSLLLQPLVLAFVPVYFKLRGRGPAVWSFVFLGGALGLGVLVVGGYTAAWTWTGFQGNTLWDWLGLFLVPFLLPLALIFLDVQLERDRANATARQGAETHPPALAAPRGWSPLSATVVAGALVLVGFTGGWIAHLPGAAISRSAAGTGPTAALATVTVNVADPSWTDTHIRVRKGQRLQISAFGLARSGASAPTVGPGGERHQHPPRQSIVPRLPHLALLATVRTPSDASGAGLPLRSALPRRLVVDVGPHDVFTAPASGELLLGVNDTGAGNNRGWFGVTVSR